MKKRDVLFFLCIFIIFSLNYISAINLDVSVKSISDSYITTLNKPAEYDLVIKNLGEDDSFEAYSLIGVDFFTENKINIKSGELKILNIKAVPQRALTEKHGYFTFEYVIKNSKDEIQRERLSMNIISLDEALAISVSNIDPISENVNVEVKNTISDSFDEIVLDMSSPFFNIEKKIKLNGFQKQEIIIPIDKEKIKSITAGQYIIKTKIKIYGKEAEKEIFIKFLEQENIESTQNTEGFLINRLELNKNNIGNTKKSVDITITKNLISSLFTSYNINPTNTNIKGFKKYYSWNKELYPNEKIKVIITTNWLYPIFIIILIFIVLLFVKKSLETDVILRKNVSFVVTKGGEFALRVHLRIRAKRYIERINVVDKLPIIVNLYEKYGATPPDKIDLVNKRLEWNIPMLNRGEERIFSYIIYSKIGVVGRFELPPAEAMYEKEGELKSANSNRAFYINEPKRGEY